MIDSKIRTFDCIFGCLQDTHSTRGSASAAFGFAQCGYMAVQQGHDDVAQMLLANGADPNKARTDDGPMQHMNPAAATLMQA